MTETVLEHVETRFAELLKRDERPGYTGYIVAADRLLETARALRSNLGYDYLSSVTGVDYLPEGKMEVVYHLYPMAGGPGLVLKAQVPRDDARLPSLVPVFPGADLQEREVWDLLGIRFDGPSGPAPRASVGGFCRAPAAQGLAGSLLSRKTPSRSRAAGRKARSAASRTRSHSTTMSPTRRTSPPKAGCRKAMRRCTPVWGR